MSKKLEMAAKCSLGWLRCLALGLLALPLVAKADLFFSEYVEGTSNNKALEIFNPTGSAIDLGAEGYNVQMYFNGSASAGLTIPLLGTVAHGGVFVLAHSSSSPTILAVANQDNASSWFNGDDAIALRKGTVVIDVIGQIGFDPGTEWGSGLTSTADNTLRRLSTVFAGDSNASDAFNPSLEWVGFATDTFDGLGAHAIRRAEAPEPASVALLALALCGLLFGRRKSAPPILMRTTASGEARRP